MTVPTFIGDIIAELSDGVYTRETLAEKLDVKPPTISGLKSGKGSLDDSKLPVLAELHGGFTAAELKGIKYLEWLEREKGITLNDLIRAHSTRSKRQQSAKAA